MVVVRTKATRMAVTGIVIMVGTNTASTNIASTIMAHTSMAIMATVSSGRISCRRSIAKPTPPT